MCGIVGVLGRGPVAGPIVEALKRLEYRGYDSAGVATLEHGRLERRRAEGKLKNLEAKLAAEPLARRDRHRPHPLGDPRQADRGQRPSARSPRLAVVHNGIIENFKALREELAAKGYRFATETDSEIAAFVGRGRAGAGKTPAAGGARGARAPARRVRARLSVRGRGRSPDRRAAGRAARDRLRRRRDVSGLRRARARPLHRPHRLSRGGRLGGGDARGRRDPRPRTASRSSAASSAARPEACWRKRAITATSWPRRSTSSPRSSATRSPITSTWRRMRLKPFAWPVDPTKLTRVSIVACGTAYMAGLIGKYWIERFARLPVEIDVASEYRYREAPVDKGGLTIVISQSGETADTLASLRYVKEQGREDGRRRQRADVEHRAADRRGGADARRARDRRRLDQGLHLPARRAGCARDRPRRARAARSTRRRRPRWSANSSRRPACSPKR